MLFSKLSNVIADRNTFKSMFANLTIKGFSLILSYIYTPLLLTYLGSEKYGLWATVLSVTVWINHCDIGIGGGLRNILTQEITKNKLEEAKKSVSTAYAVLSILSFSIWLILTIVTLTFGWKNIYNTQIDIDMAMVISYSFICINFILALVNVVLYALQISEQIAFVNLLGGIINIVGTLVLTRTANANLIYVAIVYGLSLSLPLAVNNFRIFSKFRWSIPSIAYFDSRKVKPLVSLGIIFFIMQLGGLMMFSTDNIIISRLFGSSEVTTAEISSKLLGLVKGFYVAMVIPVWGRTAKAITTKDFGWLRKMYTQLMAFLLLFGGMLVILFFFFQPITKLWLGQELYYDTGMLIVIAAGTYAEMINSSFSNMLNGLGKIKVQMCFAIFQVIINIPLSIILAVNFDMKVTGVKLATTVLLFTSGLSYMIYSKVYIATVSK